ncbi:hypothetical protein ABKN59_006364 [Abortiporus biennis]
MSDNAPKKQTKAHLRDAVELSRRLQINIRTSSSFYTLLVPKIYSPPPHLLTAVHLNTHREKTYKNSDTLTNSIDPLGFPLKQSEPFNLRDVCFVNKTEHKGRPTVLAETVKLEFRRTISYPRRKNPHRKTRSRRRINRCTAKNTP